MAHSSTPVSSEKAHYGRSLSTGSVESTPLSPGLDDESARITKFTEEIKSLQRLIDLEVKNLLTLRNAQHSFRRMNSSSSAGAISGPLSPSLPPHSPMSASHGSGGGEGRLELEMGELLEKVLTHFAREMRAYRECELLCDRLCVPCSAPKQPLDQWARTHALTDDTRTKLHGFFLQDLLSAYENGLLADVLVERRVTPHDSSEISASLANLKARQGRGLKKRVSFPNDTSSPLPIPPSTPSSRAVPNVNVDDAPDEPKGDATSPTLYLNRRISHSIAHRFSLRSLRLPSPCHYCQKMLLVGVVCKECGYRCHYRCSKRTPPSCGLPSELENYFRVLVATAPMVIRSPSASFPSGGALPKSSAGGNLGNRRGYSSASQPHLSGSPSSYSLHVHPGATGVELVVDDGVPAMRKASSCPLFDEHLMVSTGVDMSFDSAASSPRAESVESLNHSSGASTPSVHSGDGLVLHGSGLSSSFVKRVPRMGSIDETALDCVENGVAACGCDDVHHCPAHVSQQDGLYRSNTVSTGGGAGTALLSGAPQLREQRAASFGSSGTSSIFRTRMNSNESNASSSASNSSTAAQGGFFSPVSEVGTPWECGVSSPPGTPLSPGVSESPLSVSPVSDSHGSPVNGGIHPGGNLVAPGAAKLSVPSPSRQRTVSAPQRLSHRDEDDASPTHTETSSAVGSPNAHEEVSLRPDAIEDAQHGLRHAFAPPPVGLHSPALSVVHERGSDASVSSGASGGRRTPRAVKFRTWDHGHRSSFHEWEIPFSEIEIGGRIGTGLTGTVYRGFWHGDVAVKVLKAANPTPPQLAAFRREVGVLRRIRHENVVLFMGACTTAPHLAIVTRYCEGPSLDTLIKGETSFAITQIADICMQVAQGMEYCHAKGIIHRDLKTKNVFLEHGGRVTIGGFGLATATQSLAYASQGSEGSLVSASTPSVSQSSSLAPPPAPASGPVRKGSVRSMAPELFSADIDPYTTKSDVYAYGILMFEMLSGTVPFKELEPFQIVYRVSVVRALPDLSLLRRDSPPLLRLVITDCLSSAPEARPEFTEVLVRLEAIPKTKVRSPSMPRLRRTQTVAR
eukprot:Opistho-2@42510